MLPVEKTQGTLESKKSISKKKNASHRRDCYFLSGPELN